MAKWTRAQSTDNLLNILTDADIANAICEGLFSEYGLADEPVEAICDWLESHDCKESAQEWRTLWTQTKDPAERTHQ
jgi:hypothetical protein